jgi:hypothetical protein
MCLFDDVPGHAAHRQSVFLRATAIPNDNEVDARLFGFAPNRDTRSTAFELDLEFCCGATREPFDPLADLMDDPFALPFYGRRGERMEHDELSAHRCRPLVRLFDGFICLKAQVTRSEDPHDQLSSAVWLCDTAEASDYPFPSTNTVVSK